MEYAESPLNKLPGGVEVEWFYDTGASERKKAQNAQNWKNFLLNKHDQRDRIVQIFIVGDPIPIYDKLESTRSYDEAILAEVKMFDTSMSQQLEHKPMIQNVFDAIEEEFTQSIGNVWYKTVVLSQYREAQLKVLKRIAENRILL